MLKTCQLKYCYLVFISTLHFFGYAQKFAIVGDYGFEGVNTLAVANMIENWHPDFVVSLGDDNYQGENRKSIDENCGQYYNQFIGNYKGVYGKEISSKNKFFPVLGNADYKGYEGEAKDYLLNQWLDFFTLPNNERYYDYVEGDIHFFALNSNIKEPDGITANSVQGQWLKSNLANSTSQFNIVYMHQPAYSSAKVKYKKGHIKHGSNVELQWPFQEWGADLVFSGDDHFYERNIVNNFYYIINGIGGRSLTPNSDVIFGFLPNVTQKHYNDDYGAILGEAIPSENKLSFKVYNKDNQVIDDFFVWKNKAQWRGCVK